MPRATGPGGNKEACLAPGCRCRVRLTRGLCPAHYSQAARRVSGGETTWQQLEAAGQCLPVRRSPWRDGRKWLRRGLA
jgi:hypothetical protein